MGLSTPRERMKQLQQDWEIGGNVELSRLIHAETERVARWLDSSEGDDGSVASGLEGVWRILKIHDHLRREMPEPARQVDWLFAPRKDWDGARPIDLMGESLEELSWLAYWLESVSLSAPEAPVVAPAL